MTIIVCAAFAQDIVEEPRYEKLLVQASSSSLGR